MTTHPRIACRLQVVLDDSQLQVSTLTQQVIGKGSRFLRLLAYACSRVEGTTYEQRMRGEVSAKFNGSFLKSLRLRKGFSQEALAQVAGIDVRTLRAAELGERSVRGDTRRRLAAALGCQADMLDAATTTLASRGAVTLSAVPRLPSSHPHNARTYGQRSTGPSLLELLNAPLLKNPPPATPLFVGRDREFASICDVVASQSTRCIGIFGLVGSGKTELALSLAGADALAREYPDGVFYVNCRSPTVRRELLLERLQELLHRDGDEATGETPRRAGADSLHDALLGRRVMLLLDGVNCDASWRYVVVPRGNLLVLTSRRRVAIPGMFSLTLTGLAREDSIALLRAATLKATGDKAVLPEPTRLGELAEYCADSPLALTIAASALRREDGDLDHYLSVLEPRSTRLQCLFAEDSQQVLLTGLDEALRAVSPRAARLAGDLLEVESPFTRADLADGFGHEAALTINELLDCGLVEHVSGRGANAEFVVHTLAALHFLQQRT